jgi:hypothetical protein
MLVEVIETVGREMALARVSDSDRITEEPVGSSIPEEVPRYWVEVH